MPSDGLGMYDIILFDLSQALLKPERVGGRDAEKDRKAQCHIK